VVQHVLQKDTFELHGTHKFESPTFPAGQVELQTLLSRLRLPTHEVQLVAKLKHVAQLGSQREATPPLL
jgi:hypothetical protein